MKATPVLQLLISLKIVKKSAYPGNDHHGDGGMCSLARSGKRKSKVKYLFSFRQRNQKITDYNFVIVEEYIVKVKSYLQVNVRQVTDIGAKVIL